MATIRFSELTPYCQKTVLSLIGRAVSQVPKDYPKHKLKPGLKRLRAWCDQFGLPEDIIKQVREYLRLNVWEGRK